MTLEACGIVEHSDECLCDVVIPHPTGWVDDAIQDMWMGPDIIRMLSYPNDMTDENILSYLENLVYAKDNWNLYNNEYIPSNNTHAMNSYPVIMRKEIRERLQKMSSPSIKIVAAELELDLDTLNHILFQSRKYMTWEQFEMFEKDVMFGDYPNVTTLAKRHGMSFRSAMRLYAYWKTPAYKTRPKTKKL
jgi:hypothetical protein